MKTTKIELDVYEDENGQLYQRVTQKEGAKNPNAVRDFFDSGDGQCNSVRWLVPLGTRLNSKAESERIEYAVKVRQEAKPEPVKRLSDDKK